MTAKSNFHDKFGKPLSDNIGLSKYLVFVWKLSKLHLVNKIEGGKTGYNSSGLFSFYKTIHFPFYKLHNKMFTDFTNFSLYKTTRNLLINTGLYQKNEIKNTYI